jgi:hypothetical protein
VLGSVLSSVSLIETERTKFTYAFLQFNLCQSVCTFNFLCKFIIAQLMCEIT